MALTTEQFQAWLEDPSAIRCTLVEVVVNDGTGEVTKYLSNRQYVTSPTDTPANTNYLPLLKSSVKFTETLALDGTGSLSYGDIAIDNTNGERDDWLNYAWKGRQISIYIGDPKFQRSDFTLIFTGVVEDIGSSDRNTLNLQLRDILQRLNAPITSAVLGNYWHGSIVPLSTYDNPNKEQVKPLVFGEVFNITPLLMDASMLEYMVHNGPIESIIEIRDNGVPLTAGTGYTVNLATGTFKLLASPAGAITCSVQGDKNTTYNTTVASIIKQILKNYGDPTVGSVTDSDIDLDNFSAFDTSHPQKVGIYITGKDNLINVCQELASSVGAQLVASRLGKLKLLKVDVPTSGGPQITDETILQYSLQISQKPEIVSTYKLGYAKNWTVQDKLLTNIPAAHKELYAQEWLSKTSTNTTAKTLYKLNQLPEQKDTYMLTNVFVAPATKGPVELEADRLVALRSVQRYIYKFTCTISFLQNANIGTMITLTHRRFGLSSGKSAQILSSEIDWDTGFINLEALV